MPKGQRKGSASASETISETLNGDMRNPIIALIENNDLIIATVVESISQAIIARLIDNTNFTKKIVNSILNSDLIGNMKQELYKSSQMDISLAADEAAKIADRISQLEMEKVKLSNEIDVLEQYSRRNCLIVHGVPDTADPVTAVLDIINNKLSVPNRCESIDRFHRLGSPSNSRLRPIIVKFTSYQARQKVFSGKRRLKGTKLLIL